MTIYIKKYYDEETDTEYISAEDIFNFLDENTEQGQHFYQFLCYVAQEFNYFNHNSSTAFGNPDLERIHGIVLGWCLGKKWQWEEKQTKNGKAVYIYANNRKDITEHGRLIMKIDKPKTPQTEIENRKDIAKTRAAFGL